MLNAYGRWGDVTGVTTNDIAKPDDTTKTLLISLVEDGTIDSSAFYVSWDGHFVDKNSTYINEYKYIANNSLNVKYIDSEDDAATCANIIADVSSADCSDFIFSTLEYTDHAGHTSGFSIENDEYKQATLDVDAASKEIIEKIEQRDTYSEEDWLIILTSDHGGYMRRHGGSSIQERMTFIVTNKQLELV